jgi:hypothetical protein
MLGDEQLDFLLSFKTRKIQQLGVLRREHWREKLHCGQVQLAAAQHFERVGELASEARGMKSQPRFGIRHMQHANGVLEHRFISEVSMQPARFDLPQVSEQLGADASVFPNAVPHTHNQLIVSQSFNSLEFFHNSPNQQEIDNTCIFELRRCVVCREDAWFRVRDQKIQERGEDDQLEQARPAAAESCSLELDGIKKLSSAISAITKKSTIEPSTQPRRQSVR